MDVLLGHNCTIDAYCVSDLEQSSLISNQPKLYCFQRNHTPYQLQRTCSGCTIE